LKKTVIFIATGAYSGYSPIAPGTAGTVAAIPLYLLISTLNPFYYATIVLALIPLSFWSSGVAEEIFEAKDSGKIVIDEIVGFLVTMFMVPAGWTYIIAGFFLFRFFDIAKVYPANKLEKIGGGAGVVADDIMAGIYANLALQILVFSGLFSLIGS